MKVNINKFDSIVEAEVLFIVNNNEKNNTSILGVFTTSELAYKAIEEQKEIIKNNNAKVPSMSIKCVVLNGSGYEGFRTFPGDIHNTTASALADNPNIRRSLELVIYEDVPKDITIESTPDTSNIYF